jgi:hypothetical protein
MHRTEDDQAQVGYLMTRRLRGRVMPCVICTMHMKTRNAGSLVEPQNQGRRFSGLGLKIGSSDLRI